MKCAIERLEFAPGASMTGQDSSPSLLIVRAGTLSIDLEQGRDAELPVLMERGEIGASAPKRGVPVELMSESVALIPQMEAYRIWNERNETTIVFKVELTYRAPSTTFVSGDPIQVESSQGVTVNAQAGMLPTDIDHPLPYQLRLIWVHAGPNETMPVHSVSGIEQAFMTDGVLEATIFAGSAAVSRRDGIGSEALEQSRALRPGDVLTAQSDSVLSYQVSGAGSATGWFVSIVPAPDTDE